MALNANWPVIEDGWAPYWNANGGAPWDRFTEVTPRTLDKGSVQRGRQYELDQVRTGELNVVLSNTDGVLDPVNAAGPFAGNIQPYQPYRKRAMWPPSVNIANQVLASGGDLGGYAVGATLRNSVAVVFSDTDPASTGTVTASGTSWQGANVIAFTVPSGTTTPTKICHSPQNAALPGQTYTLQMRIRNVTPSTSLQVKAGIGWYLTPNPGPATSFTYGSTVTLTGSTTASWTQVTVTATAPAGSMGMDPGVMVAATSGATCSVQVDGWQVEKGPSASTWVAPGVWYPMYEGFVERWTPTWRGGTYGTVTPTAVDAFALLSQKQLSDPLTQEINSHNPRFLYKLDDPQDSSGASDATGNYPGVQLGVSKYGAGSLVFGTQITATDPVGGVYTGSTASVATVNNPNPGTNLLSGATFLKLTSAGISGPADPTRFTRMVAFRYTGPTPAGRSDIWSSMDKQRSGGNPSGTQMFLTIVNTGLLQLWLYGPTGANVAFPFPGTSVVDGNWHLAMWAYDAGAATMQTTLGGVNFAYSGVNPALTPTGIAGDNLGGFVDITNGGGTIFNYKGDIAFACEFPTALGSTDATNLYTAWKNAFTGDSTDARYSRILNYAGWSALSNIQTGLTTSMGQMNTGGQDALTALQAVVDTEGGAHFVGTDGRINFRSRSARYNATVPMFVFGENVAGGELPYEDCQLDYDPTHLANQVTVTQESSGQQFAAQDATSIQAYFPRTLTRTVNSSSAAECQDAAAYLLSRYKQPAIRVSVLTFHPSATPSLWPVLLGLELGTRVRVVRRPFGAPQITIECFVESIQWDMDDGNDAVVTLQCSPADLTAYGLFAAWHTTLKTSVLAGVTSVVVNASADTTNLLATQLGPGQQIVLGQNTANQETVTIAAVGATSPGWTSATLTLTAATTKAHTAGDLINEPLPAGVTDPTTFDASSMFDSIAFAY